MQRQLLPLHLGLAVLMSLAFGTNRPAEAAYIVTLDQMGSNVVATGSGSLDLTDLSLYTTEASSPFITGTTGFLIVGADEIVQLYASIMGPSDFGSGSGFLASDGLGDLVGVYGNTPIGDKIFVPLGYVSVSGNSA